MMLMFITTICINSSLVEAGPTKWKTCHMLLCLLTNAQIWLIRWQPRRIELQQHKFQTTRIFLHSCYAKFKTQPYMYDVFHLNLLKKKKCLFPFLFLSIFLALSFLFIWIDRQRYRWDLCTNQPSTFKLGKFFVIWDKCNG